MINFATAHSKGADLDLGPFVVSSFLLSHYKGEQCLSVKPERLKMRLCFFHPARTQRGRKFCLSRCLSAPDDGEDLTAVWCRKEPLRTKQGFGG